VIATTFRSRASSSQAFLKLLEFLLVWLLIIQTNLGLANSWTSSPKIQANLGNLTDILSSSPQPFSPVKRAIFQASSGLNNGDLNTPRSNHTATLLPNGKVLIVGGLNPATNIPIVHSELYDPSTGQFTASTSASNGDLNYARSSHTATLLPNGKVLIIGGLINATTRTARSELYDPSTGQFTASTSTSNGDLSNARSNHTATLLPNGKVLVVGGLINATTSTAHSELYDPSTGQFTVSTGITNGDLTNTRSNHTATLLATGKILVIGGYNGIQSEVYDLATNKFTPSTTSLNGNLNYVRNNQVAIAMSDGTVLVAGGFDNSGTAIPHSEVYSPATGQFTKSTTVANGDETYARGNTTAVLLPNGQIIVIGGATTATTVTTHSEIYTTGKFIPTNSTSNGDLLNARSNHTATLLTDGRILIAGGKNGTTAQAHSEIYTYALGSFESSSNLNTGRYQHTATLLPTGQLVIIGGKSGTGAVQRSELYDPTNATLTNSTLMQIARYAHTATLLPNGKILIVGGTADGTTPVAASELYDPTTQSFTTLSANDLSNPRFGHTATLLPNGKVLIVGGINNNANTTLAQNEIYDPVTNKFSNTATLNTPRYAHSAILLPNGKVLISGGLSNGGTAEIAQSEVYDPVAGTFSQSTSISNGNLNTARHAQTATLLPNGKVLLVGGVSGSSEVAASELYDPNTGVFTVASNLILPRYEHTATLLPSGKVLISGGSSAGSVQIHSEVYDPATALFTVSNSSSNGDLANGRIYHTASLLPNGQIVVVGGSDGVGSSLTYVQSYNLGLGFNASTQPPTITKISASSANGSSSCSGLPNTMFCQGQALVITGTQFTGYGSTLGTYGSQASGSNGSQDSATNYPIIQIRRLDNEQSFFLLSDPTSSWSNTNFKSQVLPAISAAGPYLLTIFSNGIPSVSVMFLLGNTYPNAVSSLNVNSTKLDFTANNSSQTLLLSAGQASLNWSSQIDYSNDSQQATHDWLSLSQSNGTILAANILPITVTAKLTGLQTGNYTASVTFREINKPENSVTVNVTLKVGIATGYIYYLPLVANHAEYISGNFFTTHVTVQNVGTGTANLQTHYYGLSGNSNTVQESTCTMLAANATCHPANPFADNTQGIGIVSSDQPLSVLVETQTPIGASAYTANTKPAATLLTPLAINHARGFNTQLTIANVSPQATVATVTFYDAHGATLPAATKTLQLAGYSSQSLDQTAADSGLPVGYYGWAKIEGSQGAQLVGQVLEQRPESNFVTLLNMPATTATSGQFSNQLYAPTIFNKAFGDFVTGANIINPNPQPVIVKLTYYDANGQAYPAAPFRLEAYALAAIYQGSSNQSNDQSNEMLSNELPNQASDKIGLPTGGLPDGFYGSAEVKANFLNGGDANIVMAVNEANLARIASGSYLAMGQGSQKLAVPLVANKGQSFLGGEATTGLSILNTAASPTTGSISYYNSDGTQLGTSQNFSIAAHASLPIYQGAENFLAEGFYGQAVVTANEGNNLLLTTNVQTANLFYTYTEPN
jgi:hypothetical protein